MLLLPLALGLLVFMYYTYTHPLRRKYMTQDTYRLMITWGIGAGFIGGRIFEVATNWEMFRNNPFEVLYPWVGGFGILGAMISIVLVLSFYFYLKKVPLLPMFDVIALYAPLLQAFSRVGCFLAGCCYGLPAPGLWCAVTYTDPACLAPLHMSLHPTQLYAAAGSFGIFLLIQGFRSFMTKPGQLISSYIFLEGLARFIVERWRGDSVAMTHFTAVQWVAIVVMMSAGIGWFAFSIRARQVEGINDNF